MNLDKYFELSKKIGFSEIEFKTIGEKCLEMELFHSNLEKYSISENETLTIRGIINGKMVSGQTENLNDIESLLNKMAENSLLIEEDKETEIFAGSEKYKNAKTYSSTLSKTDVSEKLGLCMEIENKAYEYSDLIKDVEITYEDDETTMTLQNSKGLKLSKKTNYGVIFVSIVAKSATDTRTAYNYKIFQDLNEINVDELIKKAADEAINSLDGTQCKSKKYKVLLSQNVFASLVGVLLSSVSGDAVNKGKSLLKDKLNEAIGSKKLTIVENPHEKKYPYFYRGFDDEGVATYKKTIVDKGVLKTYLYNIEAAKKAGTKSTGNGYGANVNVSFAYVYVKPGKYDESALCGKIKNGLKITNVAGLHSGMNPLSGDFSLQASGFMIENGKVTTPVNLITIAGNIFELFKNVSEVGSDSLLTFSKISSPSVIIKKLAVSGK